MKQLRLLFAFAFIGLIGEVFAQHSVNTLLYKVQVPGNKKPSYLFGTIHKADDLLVGWSKPFHDAFAKCDIIAGEVKLLDPAEQMAMLRHILMKDTLLEQLLSPADSALVWEAMAASKTPTLAMLGNRMKPFFLAVSMLESAGQGDLGRIPDVRIQQMAIEKGKRLEAMETNAEHYGALDHISYRKQAEFLVELTRNIEFWKNELERTKDYYLRGEVEELMKIDESLNSFEGLEESLIHRRNEKMIERFMEIASSSSLFCAVGAAHLPGATGLVEGLRARGCKVEPVPFQFGPVKSK